jgi:hypothetical protein
MPSLPPVYTARAATRARVILDTMAEDSTRQLLKLFGVAVTGLEEAVEAGTGDAARKAEADLRARMKELIALIERLSERAAKL